MIFPLSGTGTGDRERYSFFLIVGLLFSRINNGFELWIAAYDIAMDFVYKQEYSQSIWNDTIKIQTLFIISCSISRSSSTGSG